MWDEGRVWPLLPPLTHVARGVPCVVSGHHYAMSGQSAHLGGKLHTRHTGGNYLILTIHFYFSSTVWLCWRSPKKVPVDMHDFMSIVFICIDTDFAQKCVNFDWTLVKICTLDQHIIIVSATAAVVAVAAVVQLMLMSLALRTPEGWELSWSGSHTPHTLIQLRCYTSPDYANCWNDSICALTSLIST